jgi:hypothetical protein
MISYQVENNSIPVRNDGMVVVAPFQHEPIYTITYYHGNVVGISSNGEESILDTGVFPGSTNYFPVCGSTHTFDLPSELVDLDSATADFSMSFVFWYKSVGSDPDTIVLFSDGTTDNRFYLLDDDKALRFIYEKNNVKLEYDVSGAGTSEWHCVMVTIDVTNIYIHVDGVEHLVDFAYDGSITTDVQIGVNATTEVTSLSPIYFFDYVVSTSEYELFRLFSSGKVQVMTAFGL